VKSKRSHADIAHGMAAAMAISDLQQEKDFADAAAPAALRRMPTTWRAQLEMQDDLRQDCKMLWKAKYGVTSVEKEVDNWEQYLVEIESVTRWP